jgi:hypothetical protein
LGAKDTCGLIHDGLILPLFVMDAFLAITDGGWDYKVSGVGKMLQHFMTRGKCCLCHTAWPPANKPSSDEDFEMLFPIAILPGDERHAWGGRGSGHSGLLLCRG